MTSEELRACLDRYALRPLAQPRTVGRGTVSRVAIASTHRGPVVVKRHSNRFDAARISLALEAHAHASTHELAPPLLITEEGRNAVLLGTFWYSVTQFAESSQTAAFDHQVLGRALAALHTCLDQFAPTKEAAGFLQLHPDPIAELRRIQAERTASPAVRAEIDWRVSILHGAGTNFEDVAATPGQWVHGDARSDNLLTAGPLGRCWFIDFDQVSRFPRTYEIVRAFVTSFCTSAQPGPAARRFTEYIAAYCGECPIPAAESDRMIDLYIAVQAAETRTFTTPDGEVRGMAEYARARKRRLTWILEHRDDLTAAAREGSRA